MAQAPTSFRLAFLWLAPLRLFLMLAALPAGAAEERRHWDWGQHHTSLAGEPPRPLPTPPPHWQHWDDHAAPVRIATPAPP